MAVRLRYDKCSTGCNDKQHFDTLVNEKVMWWNAIVQRRCEEDT